jgi:uncharacterized protein (TIGR02145 family)
VKIRPKKPFLAVASSLSVGLIAFFLVIIFTPRVQDSDARSGTQPVWVGDPFLSLTLPDDDTLSPGRQLKLGAVNPSDTAPTVKPFSMRVLTNNPSGYHLGARMFDANRCIRHRTKLASDCGQIGSAFKIDPLPVDSLLNAFPNNTWGMSQPDTPNFFHPVPASTGTALTLKDSSDSSSNNGDIIQSRIAVKVDPSKAAGKYYANIDFSLIGHPTPLVNITSVVPDSVKPGETLTLIGTNLNYLFSLKIAGVTCESVLIESPTRANCIVGDYTPVGPNQPITNILSIYNQPSTTTTTVNVLVPSPIITSVTPDSGHFRGGGTITITGKYFTGATDIKVGERSCSSFNVLNDTTATCITQGITDTFLDYTVPTFNPEASASNPVTNFAHSGLMANPTRSASVNITTPKGTNTNNSLFTYRYQARSYSGAQAGSYLEILGEGLKLGSKLRIGSLLCEQTVVTSSTTAVCTQIPSQLSTGSVSVTIQNPPAPTHQFQPQSASTALPTFSCSSLSVPSYTTTNWNPYTRVVRDTRDGKSYRVRKMPDGRCWMIDNLALSTKTTISANDTDIASDAGPDFITKWNSLNNNGQPVQNAPTHNNGVCTSHSSVPPADGTGYLSCDGRSDSGSNDGYIAYSDPSLPSNSLYENCTKMNGISPNSLTGCGYLYNWYTATAGSGNYQKVNTNVDSSICPKGWHLPKGEAIPSQNEFAILNNAMATGSTTPSTTDSPLTRPNWRDKGPFEGSLAGWHSSNPTGTGNSGFYWSSAGTSNDKAQSVQFLYRQVDPKKETLRRTGISIRCVL